MKFVLGDITTLESDIIVNAANPLLEAGSGVCGAIHRAAGPTLAAACTEIPTNPLGVRCPTGQVRITSAGDLPAKWVIHAVGPIYSAHTPEQSAEFLYATYRSILMASVMLGARKVTIPAISCGIYGYPLDKAAQIAVWGMAVAPPWMDVTFVLFTPDILQAFETAHAEFNT